MSEETERIRLEQAKLKVEEAERQRKLDEERAAKEKAEVEEKLQRVAEFEAMQ